MSGLEIETFSNARMGLTILIVEAQPELGTLWQRHLERQGASVDLVEGQTAAIGRLHIREYDIIILNVVLENGSAFAVSDYASYRHPRTRVIFVSNSTFFSDGSIFQHSANACAFIKSETPPEDLAAMIEHYAADR